MNLNATATNTPPFSFYSMTMARGLRAIKKRSPYKVAICHGEKKRTFSDLSLRTDALTAVAISSLGLKKGDNAAIFAKNSIEYVEIVCGFPEAGVPLALINPSLKAREVEEICNDAEAKILFVDDNTADEISSAKFKTVEKIIHIGRELELLIDSAVMPDQLPDVNEWDPWTIPYTSGTTGKPKGVILSHRSRLLGFYQIAVEYGCFSPEDEFLGTTPMHHGAGIAYPLAAIMFGGFTEILDKFDPELLLKKLKENNFSGVFTVPTQHHNIFSLEDRILNKYRRPRIKSIISNAAPLSQQLKYKIVDYFGDNVLHETYGSTECGFVSNLRPPYQLSKINCVGTPFTQVSVKLTDSDFHEVGEEEPGELWVKSSTAFNGYWNNPKATSDAFNDHGWISVGDVGKRDSDGFIYIVDRIKDMIISGGVNIYPREIEEVLLSHPDILENSIIGVPDEKWGERLRAFIVTKDNKNITVDELSKFCENKLSRYKVPKDIKLIESLPKNATGKILKRELRNKN